MRIRFVAVDPGKSGGVAIKDEDGQVSVIKAPSEGVPIRDFVEAQLALAEKHIIFGVELVGGSHNSLSEEEKQLPPDRIAKIQEDMLDRAPGVISLAAQFGRWEQTMLCHRAPVSIIPPSAWMRKTVPDLPKGRTNYDARKRRIRDYMQEVYPNIRVTLWNADALGILTYMVNNPSTK